MKQIQDFKNDSTQNAITAFKNDNNPLAAITDKENGISDDADRVFQGDKDPDSISDCAAHLIYFRELLKEKNEVAVAEWRGLLCEIFYSGLLSQGKITSKPIPVAGNSYLQRIFAERLSLTDANIFTNNAFNVFCKNGTPFALFVPDLIFLPFRNLNASLFRTSLWANGTRWEVEYGNSIEKISWDKTVINQFFIDNRGSETLFFLSFLNDLSNQPDIFGTTADTLISDFINDILINCYPGQDINNIIANVPNVFANMQNNAEPLSIKEIVETVDVTKYSPALSGDYLLDDIFCFKTYIKVDDVTAENQIENIVAHSGEWDAWKGYKISHQNLLTPIKLKGFCGEDPSNAIYVVPPVNNSFLEAISSADGVIAFEGWSAEVAPDDKESIIVHLNVKVKGVLHSVPHAYKKDHIAISDDMPYISMWPYVSASEGLWNEYFVTVAKYNGFAFAFDKPSYDFIDKTEVNKITPDMLKFSIFGISKVYDIKTDPFGLPDDPDSKFVTYRTEEFPEFITLTYRKPDALADVAVGCWQINKAGGIKLLAQNGTPGVVGFDFATTSSIAAISVNGGTAEFIDGPGTYLYDVFNPYWVHPDSNKYQESHKDWETKQTYYLFGSKKDSVNKIYSYGQNNIPTIAGEVQHADFCYVSGRTVFVDFKYIQHIIKNDDANNEIRKTIYYPLKWTGNNIAKQEAAENFVRNCLMWALLMARKKGCDSLRINVSHPLDNNNAPIMAIMQKIITSLREVSGFGEALTYGDCSEAEANARFITEGRNKQFKENSKSALAQWRAQPNIIEQNGYMLVDIGGGTTDIAVCQYSNPDIPFDQKLKNELSFKYAGKQLVDLSLLKIDDFDKIWAPTKGSPVSKFDLEVLLKDYKKPLKVTPITYNDTHLESLIAVIGFLLDNAYIEDNFKGSHIGNRMRYMKVKYISLFWIIGRYLRKLSDAGKITLKFNDPMYRFSICLTGCASKALKTFCAENEVSANGFLDACAQAAEFGFYNNDPGEIPPFIDVLLLSEGLKREVALGLTTYDGAPTVIGNRVPAGRRGLVPPRPQLTAQPVVENQPVEPEYEFNAENVKQIFDSLLTYVSFYEHGDACWNEKDEFMNKYSATINSLINTSTIQREIKTELNCDGMMLEELYALYVLETILDEND